MFSFAYGLEDKVEILGEVYQLNLSYDVVLRFLDLLSDKEISEKTRLNFSMKLLLGPPENLPPLSIEDQAELINQVIQTQVLTEKPAAIFASMNKKETAEKEYYSIEEDADIIFASFYYDYHLDLIEERGRLHWKKFKALLNGLSDKTKLAQVIGIRKWKPNKYTSPEEESQMKELQEYYSLGVSQKDAEELLYFNSLSGEEKEAFARKRLAELEGEKNG
ncbi:Gp15 family bacteriophage protein [Enterococcus sp. AZ103]|uniref:Gp15 family bacteriophage protein n=1 Tax=Enterococcus sp. AZ103 TaxID=2774628 RepID=UPI003F1FD4EB